MRKLYLCRNRVFRSVQISFSFAKNSTHIYHGLFCGFFAPRHAISSDICHKGPCLFSTSYRLCSQMACVQNVTLRVRAHAQVLDEAAAAALSGKKTKVRVFPDWQRQSIGTPNTTNHSISPTHTTRPNIRVEYQRCIAPCLQEVS